VEISRGKAAGCRLHCSDGCKSAEGRLQAAGCTVLMAVNQQREGCRLQAALF